MEQPLDTFRSSTWGWLRATLAGWGTLALCLVGIGFIILLVKWFENLAASFELTPERIVIRRGIFIKSVDEIELYRVKDIRLDYSLINQWAGIGTITLTSSDGTTRYVPLVLPDIENAEERREEIRRLVEAARQRRRVREVDMTHEDY
jgi:uncharacterized membrane protein YdbT with pleckstrin-like domain